MPHYIVNSEIRPDGSHRLQQPRYDGQLVVGHDEVKANFMVPPSVGRLRLVKRHPGAGA